MDACYFSSGRVTQGRHGSSELFVIFGIGWRQSNVGWTRHFVIDSTRVFCEHAICTCSDPFMVCIGISKARGSPLESLHPKYRFLIQSSTKLIPIVISGQHVLYASIMRITWKNVVKMKAHPWTLIGRWLIRTRSHLNEFEFGSVLSCCAAHQWTLIGIVALQVMHLNLNFGLCLMHGDKDSDRCCDCSVIAMHRW